ncbi:MAG: NusA-like transcription termination signal-binding factor [Nanoarchaeota archaeon]|nr:NusA-like transcription termination signal-binding factor [Nanoarchaeota archaeon]MBU1321106.1 NusA-like transcription termination signal-binding factor [Nanoarchaeota archaeon]MBU1597627.1 NusA-like transcription termination signal-binding factor [Nanoarchaeota archaeon]MBU2441386.1 NusA-like transcription termination signal-binding factor [Nanoarchaeota archaeon]
MISQKISFDTDMIKFMSLFESITHSQLKDCFFDREKLVFVVDQGEMAKALGKNKANITKLEKLLKRKLKIVEFNENRLQFITNYLAPLRVTDISEEGDTITVTGADTKTKGLMIGIKAQNLRNLENVIRKYFKIDEIKVV